MSLPKLFADGLIFFWFLLYQGPAVVYKAQGGVSHLLVLWSSKFYGTTGLFLHIFTNSVSIFEIKQ